ncbi:MAG: DNA photolyase family protein [Candidatus Megaira endosymbiont of Mesostigma viride]|nr:MAG: DNA photolyase family protein [Candidatus Megaira endosymbiont of Mesostigma viride]HJK87816.1 deoxyribodipyrimidine photo-lyase [Candidatus Megaira endosymbiont of Mesostigma viride]
MKKLICWFRCDLRTHDNPALYNAAKEGLVLPIYILNGDSLSERPIGCASKVWLHHSLVDLNKKLANNLIVRKGNPIDILAELVNFHKIDNIYWNRCYEPWQVDRDKKIKKIFEDKNIKVKSYNASLLWEPWNILKNDGTPYKVFTPFYRKGCLGNDEPRIPLPKPEGISYVKNNNSTNIRDLKLLPEIQWNKKFDKYWNIGEDAACKRLDDFLESGLKGYKEGRNFPYKDNTSCLSPYLHFGEISPNYIWHKVISQENKGYIQDIDHFCSELGWREFSYYLLYHFPYLPKQNLNRNFDIFPWREDKIILKLWQKGETGVPIVDAGMRQLWEMGYMHNRMRMIVGSFLVKNLLLHWKYGEKWFWDCLVDADLANNSASWQWIAGCGADAAPYFRIFNPVTQGQKFDPEGSYTRKFVPELKNLPNEYLFNPWEAPEHILSKAGINLGIDYPKPIVNLKESRDRALISFASLKNKTP